MSDFVEIPILRVKEIPEYTSANAGHVLTIKSDGSLDWSEPADGIVDVVNAAYNNMHEHSMADLSDVNLTNLATGDVLVWNGSSWKPSTISTDGVASVNNKTGIILLVADDIDDSGSSHKFVTEAQLNKLNSLNSGAEANPAKVTASEITNANSTAERSYSPVDIKAFIDQHAAAAGGQVSSVNAKVGAVILDTDDISEGTTNKFVSSAEKTKLGAIEAGAEVNPQQVGTLEKTAGTEANLRSYAPSDIKDMIDTHAPTATAPSLNDITNVSTAGATNGQTIIYDGAGNWSPGDVGTGGGSSTLDGLTDVDTSTVPPTDGQALVWDSANSQWEPGTVVGGGGAVDSVNLQTGAVVLDTDDISEGASNKYLSVAQEIKLDGIETGAQVNPTQVSAGEKTAGTETAVRGLSPQDVHDMIDTHGAAGVSDHAGLTGVGTNTHVQIDTHIADTSTHFADAPSDGNDYVRKNGGWVEPTFSAVGTTDMRGFRAIGDETYQSVSSGSSWHVVTNWAEVYDNEAWFNPATGVFSPNLAGYYMIGAKIPLQFAIADGKRFILSVYTDYPNGQQILDRRYGTSDTTGNQQYLNGAAIVYMNGTTDALELRLTHDNGSAYSIGNDSAGLGHYQEFWAVKMETAIQGVAGADGSNGLDGSDGKTILNGTAIPTTEGVDGDFYLKTDTMDLYGPKSGTWGSATSLVGPTGAQGNPGNDGADGAAGQGVPTGGTANQVLAKIDGTDYNTQWVAQSGGASALGDLSDVTTAGATNGQALVSDGAGNWLPGTVSGGGGAGGGAGDLDVTRYNALGTQSLSDGGYTAITDLDQAAYSNVAGWTPATGTFQPTTAGYYEININCTFGSATGSGYIIARLQDGSAGSDPQPLYIRVEPDGSAYQTLIGSANLYFNGSTDYVTLEVGNFTGSALTFFKHSFIEIVHLAAGGAAVLDDLTDVDVTTTAPTDGQALVWDNASSKFVPGDVAAGSGTPVNNLAFSATISGTQSIPSNTGTELTSITNVEADVGNCYDSVTGRFTPTEAGWYTVSAQLGVAGFTIGENCGVYIKKNGADLTPGIFSFDPAVSGYTYLRPSISGRVYLNGTTDYVSIFCWHNGSAARTMGEARFSAVQDDKAAQIGSSFTGARAVAAGGQVLTSGVWTVVELNTEDFDTGADFDPATDRFTASEAGFYQVNVYGSLGGLSVNTSNSVSCGIRKNGTDYLAAQSIPISGTSVDISCSALVQLNAGDYVQMEMYHNNGANRTIGAGYTNMQVAKIEAFDGASSLDNMSDVDTSTTAPSVGDKLEWDGTNWVPAPFKGMRIKCTHNVQAFSAANTWTDQTVFDVVDFDTLGGWNAATGTWTVPEDGIYDFIWNIYYRNSTNGNVIMGALEVNGTFENIVEGEVNKSSGFSRNTLGTTYQLTAGDTVKVRAYSYDDATVNADSKNSFSIKKVG